MRIAEHYVAAFFLLAAASAAARPTASEKTILAPRVGSTKALEITALPGFSGDLPSAHYSGYVPVSEDNDKQLFYWLVSSEGSVRDDPVVLWLTGGPGCSAMDALVYEHGPFIYSYASEDEDEEVGEILLEENPFSWSKAATMIYVDSPAGVGMSYSSDPERDYVTNNMITIEDLYSFLQQVLDEFPSLRDNDLYIAGESYGGVYVPLLAKKVVDMNQMVEQERRLLNLRHTTINLKGYMSGNGVTDDEIDGNAQMEYALNLGLIDPPTYQAAWDACDGVFWNASRQENKCTDAVKDAYNTFYWVNPYDILHPCTHHGSGRGRRSSLEMDVGLLSHMHSAQRWFQTAAPMLKHTVPCGDRRISLDWMNRGDVREAIHAAPLRTVPSWQPCSDVLHYTVGKVAMREVHRELLQRGLRVLVYSGDHDFVIPYIGTRSWVYGLGLPVDQPYAAWMVEGQVAGFVATFEGGLTFATVKGAGHMVPQTNPREALDLISRFLNKELYPSRK